MLLRTTGVQSSPRKTMRPPADFPVVPYSIAPSVHRAVITPDAGCWTTPARGAWPKIQSTASRCFVFLSTRTSCITHNAKSRGAFYIKKGRTHPVPVQIMSNYLIQTCERRAACACMTVRGAKVRDERFASWCRAHENNIWERNENADKLDERKRGIFWRSLTWSAFSSTLRPFWVSILFSKLCESCKFCSLKLKKMQFYFIFQRDAPSKL
jgi:hypothetical protein